MHIVITQLELGSGNLALRTEPVGGMYNLIWGKRRAAYNGAVVTGTLSSEEARMPLGKVEGSLHIELS